MSKKCVALVEPWLNGLQFSKFVQLFHVCLILTQYMPRWTKRKTDNRSFVLVGNLNRVGEQSNFVGTESSGGSALPAGVASIYIVRFDT